MRPLRAVTGSILIAVALQPASLGATPTQELGASNVFTSARSGYIEVRIPHDARWKFDFFDASLRIEGDGRFAGFFLVRQDSAEPQGLYAGNFRVCPRKGCSKGWTGWVTRFAWPVGLKWKGRYVDLPAGRYHAYIIADGAEVSARLSLLDLDGSHHFSTTTLVDSAVGVEVPSTPFKNVLVAGSTHKLTTDGAAITAFLDRNRAGAAGFFHDCLYRGTPPFPHAVAFSPACQGLGADTGWNADAYIPPLVSSGASGYYRISPRLDAGKWSYGGSYVGAHIVRNAAFVSVWVSYE